MTNQSQLISELLKKSNGSLQQFQHLLSTHKRTAALFAAAVVTFGLLYPKLKFFAARYVAAHVARNSSSLWSLSSSSFSDDVERWRLPVSSKLTKLPSLSDETIIRAETIKINDALYKRIENDGNGDCQYIAFANACGFEATSAVIHLLRSIVAEALPRYSQDVLKIHIQGHNDITAYRALIKSNNSIDVPLWQEMILGTMWGDALTLQILLDNYEVNAKCFNDDGSTTLLKPFKLTSTNDALMTLYLLYYSEVHYEALLPIEE